MTNNGIENSQPLETEKEISVSVLEQQGTNKNMISYSPQDLVVLDESELFVEDKKENVFRCTICATTSMSKSGIKIHITRTHKSQRMLLHSERVKCKKCSKEIKDKAEAGICTSCKGMEHYRCTETGKKYKEKFLAGMSFKCVQCCVPGIDLRPKSDAQNMALEDKGEGHPKVETTSSPILPLPDDARCERQPEAENGSISQIPPLIDDVFKYRENPEGTSNVQKKEDKLMKEDKKQLKDDNIKLTQKLKEIIQEVEQLRVKNTKLEGYVETLEKETTILSGEKEKLAEQYNNSQTQLELMAMDKSKTQEIALEIQKALTATMKEANKNSYNKDTEIQRLVKDNERLKAENNTYKKLSTSKQHSLQHKNNIENIYVDCTRNDTKNRRVTFAEDEEYYNDQQEFEEEEAEMLDKEIEKPKDQNRYCHFFNREGCTNTQENCRFLHEVSPICQQYLNGRCRRKLCMFRHSKEPKEIEEDHSHEDEDPEVEPPSVKSRPYCHFYNRNGCSKEEGKCRFLHEESPPCKRFMNGNCHRRLCMYRHEKRNFQDGKQIRPQNLDQAKQHVPQQEEKSTLAVEEEVQRSLQQRKSHIEAQNTIQQNGTIPPHYIPQMMPPTKILPTEFDVQHYHRLRYPDVPSQSMAWQQTYPSQHHTQNMMWQHAYPPLKQIH